MTEGGDDGRGHEGGGQSAESPHHGQTPDEADVPWPRTEEALAAMSAGAELCSRHLSRRGLGRGRVHQIPTSSWAKPKGVRMDVWTVQTRI